MIVLFFVRENLELPEDSVVGLDCTRNGVPILCDRINGAPSYTWVTLEYAVAIVDAVIYMFLPWWTTVLLRLVQGRPWLHRVSGRSILIGDVPWVAQSIEAYVSKLFALSYSIASVSVASGNPTDHLVHRHTHRVVRGGLLAIGRPDGRLNALASAEATTCLSVNQASSIQNFGVTCESVTIGHSPFKLPLSAQHLTLPSHRPKFFCEAECDARLGKVGALDGMSAGGVMGALEELQAKTDSLALSKFSNKRSSSSMAKSTRTVSSCGSRDSRDSWVSATNGTTDERSTSAYASRDAEATKRKSALLGRSSMSQLGYVSAGSIPPIDEPFLGAWMRMARMTDEDDAETIGRKRSEGEAYTVGDLMAKQRFVQTMYEARIASLQRLVAFFVMFYEMGKRVQDFWPAASFGIFGYDMSRSQSIMRIATTASPVSGAEVRHRVLALGEEETRGWGAQKIQVAQRMLKAKGASHEQLMEMVMQGRLSQAQLNQIMKKRGGTMRRGGVAGEGGGPGGGLGFGLSEAVLETFPKADEVRALLINACKNSVLFSGSSREQLGDAADACRPIDAIDVGGDVIKQGDAEGDLFFIVESGEFSVHLKQANDAEVHRYSSGGSFGELALMYNCPRAATVRCANDGALWAIDRRAYQHIMRRAGKGGRDVALSALSLVYDGHIATRPCLLSTTRQLRSSANTSPLLAQVPALAELTDEQREDLAGSLEEIKVAPGDVIVQPGDEADALYLIKQGGFVLTATGKSRSSGRASHAGAAPLRAQEADSFSIEPNDATMRLQAPSHFGAFALVDDLFSSDTPTWDRSVLAASDKGASSVCCRGLPATSPRLPHG